MVEFYADPGFVGKLGNCLTKISCEPRNAWKEVRPNIRQDEFGVQWDRSVDKDIGVVCNCVLTSENLNDYAFPDPDDPSRYERFPQGLERNQHNLVVCTIGFSLFERAWTLVGMDTILAAMLSDRDFAHAVFDRLLALNLRLIENVCRFQIDAVMFGDDWGHQHGLLMGGPLWREFVKPRVQQMYAAVRGAGKYVFIHSCGKVDELFPDLIECGLHVFNPFQPEVMDPFDIKRRYGSQLTFFGGISTQRTLPYATVSEVRDEVRRLIEVVGKGGGYIAAPAHAIPGDARPENIAAMIEVLQNQ
jgi:uroporphyrinogen decarboxylase